MYYDLKTETYIKNKESKSLKFLYNNFLGRAILRVLINPKVSKMYAKYMNSLLSKHKIKRFVKRNRHI